MSHRVLYRAAGHEILLAGSRIERRAFVALRDVQRTTEAARAVARSLLSEAQAQIQAEFELARRRGYDDGAREGIAAVLGAAELEQRLRELLAARLADVVQHCLRSLLGEIGADAAFRQRALHLLRAGDGDAVATLLVHPTDVGRTRDLLAELTAHYRRPLGWLQVREAGHVEPGDLVLETRMGFVQNNLTLTLASLRDLVVQAVERAQAQLPLAMPPR